MIKNLKVKLTVLYHNSVIQSRMSNWKPTANIADFRFCFWTGQFMGYTLVLLVLSTSIAVVVLNLHHKGALGTRPPEWIKRVLFGAVASVFCMRHVIKFHEQVHNKITAYSRSKN